MPTSSNATSPQPGPTNCGWPTPLIIAPKGKLYVCAIKDVFSNHIVGYSIDSRMKSLIAVNSRHRAVVQQGNVPG
jgi:transposase InsO family protein